MSENKKNINVAHDIRNSVAVINGYLQYRKKEYLSPEELEYWQAAQKCAERLIKLAQDMSLKEKEEDLPEKKTIPPRQKLTTTRSNANKQVLVIDDDQEIQIIWKNLLLNHGMAYLGVDRGESLLRMDIDYSKISTAIVDYEFEDSSLNGFDIVEYLRRKQVKSVHLCTGLYDNREIKELAKRHGVDSIIAKPLPEDISNIFKI